METIICCVNNNFPHIPGAYPLRGTTAMPANPQVDPDENPRRNCKEEEDEGEEDLFSFNGRPRNRTSEGPESQFLSSWVKFALAMRPYGDRGTK